MIAIWFATAAFAGAWTRDAGDYYAHIGADYYVPRVYVDPLTGRPVATDRRYFGQQYGFYGEFGLSKAWPVQVGAAVPLSIGSLTFDANGGTGRATTWRLGDARVFGQIALSKHAPLALVADFKIPMYANGGVGAHQGVYQPDFPKPGDGQIDASLWFTGGGGIPHTSMWAEGAVGWVHRTEVFVGWNTDLHFTDGIGVNATCGGHLGKAILMAKLDARFNPVNDELTREWLTVGPAMMFDVAPGLAIEGRFAYDAWAAHAAKGMGFGVGISSRHPK